MAEFVVIARSELLGATLELGPFTDLDRSGAASGAMCRLGYVSEVFELARLSWVGPGPGEGEQRAA